MVMPCAVPWSVRHCIKPLRALVLAVAALALAAQPCLAELQEPPRSMPVAELLEPEVIQLDDGAVVGEPVIEGEAYAGPTLMPDGQLAYWPNEPWDLYVLPDGLMYHSYLAGGRESRFASIWAHEESFGWIWDISLGGRVGILRWGTAGSDKPEGWQLDIEGAAFPRLDLEVDRDLISVDFRFGVPLTYSQGQWHTKLAFYHLSSHLGDEYLARFPLLTRVSYSRDAMVLGIGRYILDSMRIYSEAGYAFTNYGGSEPWEFQFGMEYSPRVVSGLRGSPFAAVNGLLREEVDYGGSLIVQTGWQWRGTATGNLFRLGFQYFNGKSEQFQFFRQHEEQFAGALWYDY